MDLIRSLAYVFIRTKGRWRFTLLTRDSEKESQIIG